MAKKSDSVAHFFGGTDPVVADELNLSLETAPDQPEDLGDDSDNDELGEIAVDVYQTDSHVVIVSPVAGVHPDQIEITGDEDSVTISGERIAEHLKQGNNVVEQEIYWGAFSRLVQLPVACVVEKATASYKHGVLTVQLPKSSKAKKKVIKVQATE